MQQKKQETLQFSNLKHTQIAAVKSTLLHSSDSIAPTLLHHDVETAHQLQAGHTQLHQSNRFLQIGLTTKKK
jgi:hypothetical protein